MLHKYYDKCSFKLKIQKCIIFSEDLSFYKLFFIVTFLLIKSKIKLLLFYFILLFWNFTGTT